MILNKGEIAFRVETETLRETSALIAQKTALIQQNLEAMQYTAQMTSGYWEGEGGDICRSAFQDFRGGIEQLIARLQEDITDLEKIAGIYEESEVSAEQETEALPEDLIV